MYRDLIELKNSTSVRRSLQSNAVNWRKPASIHKCKSEVVTGAVGAGGTIGWRTCKASGAGVLLGCSGIGSPAGGEVAFGLCDDVPESGGAVAAGVPESASAGRECTSDDPILLRKAGAVFVAF